MEWTSTAASGTPTLELVNTGCVSNCSGHGVCAGNECECDTSYCLDDCSKTFIEVLGPFYLLYTIFFGVSFLLVCFWACSKIYRLLRFAGRKSAFKLLPIIYYLVALDGLGTVFDKFDNLFQDSSSPSHYFSFPRLQFKDSSCWWMIKAGEASSGEKRPMCCMGLECG